MKQLRNRPGDRHTGRLLVALVVWGGMSLGNVFAQSPDLNGILESTGEHSAIFEISPESGDLVGYAFRNDSSAGRSILGQCIAGMPCAVQRVRAQEFLSGAGEPQGFEDQPSGWMEVRYAQGARLVSAMDRLGTEVTTRHGPVAVDPKNRLLQWNGKPLWAPTPGQLSIVHHYQWSADDLLLVQIQRDPACPVQYRFVLVSARAAVPTEEFGSCSDIGYSLISRDAQGKKKAVVRMVEHAKPSSTEAERKRANRTRVEYAYSEGTLTLNGKQVGARNKVGNSGRGLR